MRQVAPQFAEQGIGIDVVPIQLTRPNDVSIEKIVLPAMPQQGETIEARVVILNDVAEPSDVAADTVSGRLRITRRAGAELELLAEQDVELTPGKNIFPLVHTLDSPPGFYTYEAWFVPNDGMAERTQQNNRATAFTNIGGKGRVLFIENADAPGEFDFLIKRLRAAEMLIDVQSTQPFSSLAELQSYDTVVLANVARTSGEGASSDFSDDQINALVRNTEMGCGLLMLGGPNSFGAGGWANTPLEEASPVNFTIKNAKVIPSGALVLVIDKSGSMQGEKIIMCRQAAMEAVRVLGPKDHIGIVAFDGTASWLLPMQEVRHRREGIARQILRLNADGGTDMFPGMQKGFAALQSVEAAVKHMIVLTDGQTQSADFERLTHAMRQSHITVSAVAVGTDADRSLLSGIARVGDGKFYEVTSPKAIPRIFIKEAMRVTKPLVYEREEGFSPQVVFPHEALLG
ncbi:MAG: VWA domain-containing protein, partial [Betaproteobacteria bacterium]